MACTPIAMLSVPWGCQLMASNSRQVCGICQRVWDTVNPIVRPIPRTSITVRASGKRGDERKNISPIDSPIIELISVKKIGSITSFARVVNSAISRFATVVLISRYPIESPRQAMVGPVPGTSQKGRSQCPVRGLVREHPCGGCEMKNRARCLRLRLRRA